MNALRLTLNASLLAFATAHAAGDEMPVETIIVTAKRPAYIESGETILVVTVTAPARDAPGVVPAVITVSPADSVVLVPPKTTPVIEVPTFEQLNLAIQPPRIVLALADTGRSQG
jgi:type II secretory pathway component HofQ